MDITYSNTVSVVDYNYLRKSVGWDVMPEKKAQDGILGSAYLVSANINDNTIGMARVITDGGCVAYIVDVIVLPEYQRQGIGKAMLTMIMTYLWDNMEQGDIFYVGLMAAKGKEAFYKQFGFMERPNEHLGAGMIQWIKKLEG